MTDYSRLALDFFPDKRTIKLYSLVYQYSFDYGKNRT